MHEEIEVDEQVLARAAAEAWLLLVVCPSLGVALGVVAFVAQWLGGALSGWGSIKWLLAFVVAGGACGGYVGWVRATRRTHYLGFIESGLVPSLLRAVARRARERGGNIPALARDWLDEQIRRLPRVTRRIVQWLARKLFARFSDALALDQPIDRITQILADNIAAFHRTSERLAIAATLLVLAFPAVAMLLRG